MRNKRVDKTFFISADLTRENSNHTNMDNDTLNTANYFSRNVICTQERREIPSELIIKAKNYINQNKVTKVIRNAYETLSAENYKLKMDKINNRAHTYIQIQGIDILRITICGLKKKLITLNGLT